jgi:5'-nucleotidase
MKNSLMLLALVLTLGVGTIGCAKKNNAAATGVNGSVADVNVAPIPPKEPQVSYAAPDEPVFVEPTVTQTPASSAAVPVAGTAGGQYVVKKGDTLFSIAKQAYGNGNQWQRIAQANPGLSPTTLKAGKTIVIP